MTLYYDDLVKKGRFQFRGRGPIYFDCYGIVLEIAKRCGKIYPEFETLCEETATGIHSAIEDCKSRFVKVDIPDIADVILFNDVFMPHVVSHMGSFVGNNRFLHATRINGIEAVDLNQIFFRDRIHGFYAYR